ncbi:MAG: SPOR domain-containing protein [Rhodospirillales bacterium]|nr:SPOR domain-containing protein [Rhodospirillales bacterium]
MARRGTKLKGGAALALAAALGLAGCGGAQEGSLFSPSFWSMSPLQTTGENDLAELGLAELAKGNHVAADNYFQKALKVNPKDVHALLGAGMLYQQTGQTTKAREMYESVLALRPRESDRLVPLAETPKPLADIANAGLGQIEGRPSTAGPGMEPPPGGVAGAPSASLMLGRTAAPPPPTGGPSVTPMRPLAPGVAEAAQRSAPIGPRFVGGDSNVVSRFATLRTLREQGLVTAEEYNARRQANIGALLPLTSPPPSAGLERPVPATDQIVGRLRAIGRALEMRALTVAQHASERAMILDALLPAAPVVVANPGVPPKEMMAAADAVRRIEYMRDGGLVSGEEYARERKAIEVAMTPPAPEPPPPMVEEKPAAPAAAAKGPAAVKGGAAVHLASYRSRQQADRGWQQIQRANKEILGKLQPEITEVNLGSGKGTYFRLKAGPLANKDAAVDLCRQLKQRRQYCEPAASDG